MSITLASVFDDRSEALRARDRLIEAGIDGTQIRIEDHQEERSTTPLRERQGEPRPTRRGFFAELFGLGDDDAKDSAGHYAEAVRRGSTVLAITLPDEARVAETSEILEDCGAVDIDRRVEQWRAGGYEAHDESAPDYGADEIRAERERIASHRSDVMPVVEEDLRVGKREVESGRVRVQRRLLERPVEEQVTLREARAVVERRPADRPAGEADLQAFQEQTIELRETREEAVVEKTTRVVEEVRVGTEVNERTETVRDTVRRSDVEVESVDPPARDAASGGERDAAPPSPLRDVYSGPNRRVANDPNYRGPERRRVVAMQ
jgi:uncharacterized protein (TIGR02271 family)